MDFGIGATDATQSVCESVVDTLTIVGRTRNLQDRLVEMGQSWILTRHSQQPEGRRWK